MYSKEQMRAYWAADDKRKKEILKSPSVIKSSKGKHGKHLQPKKKKRK